MDISLYKLALDIKPPPSGLLVSPTTLLSLAQSVIEVLVEQQISATIWLKLPPGKIWYSAIKRYHEQVKVSHTTYVCHTQKVLKGHIAQESFPIVPVQLVAKSQLRRDYFLLVLSSEFSSLILAHRSRMRGGRIMPLLSVCSFEGKTIQGVLDGLKHSITQSVRLGVGSQSQTINTDLLKNWDALFSFSAAPNPVLLEQLLAKQIQQQDAVRRSAINQRITTLQQQNQQLLESLNRQNESFYSMCQELIAPVTNMRAALGLLNSPHLKPPQKQLYLQLLSSDCERQISVINRLIELMRLENSAEQTVIMPLRLSDIVPGVVSIYQPIAGEKGIMLAYTVSTDLPAVYCSPAWLKQIVIELLHNSIKFTGTNGRVWVIASVQGDYVQLEFRDTGIGISPNEMPKIFDLFYRVRSASSDDPSGAGLGLTIVQQLLLRCKGSISVKNRVGGGSIFNVLLAIAPSTGEARGTRG